MRLSLIILVFILGSIGSNQAYGQIQDSLLYFKTSPSQFFEAGDLNALKGTFVTLPNIGKFKTIQRNEALKISVPISSKVVSDDVILFNTGKCYRFHTKKGRLIWFDRNRDGKVQALQELRSIGANGKPSKVYVEEVSCK